jgi:7-cyano-7-deazaguanine reductase
MAKNPSKDLEVFPNPRPERNYTITMECPEFTCLCPRTGQPDFATIHIRFIPDQLCIELKSLKLYLWSYRDEGAFHEAVINRILDDLVDACKPRFMEIVGDFYVRGGIYTSVRATYGKEPADAEEEGAC